MTDHWALPKSINVGGTDYPIRTDYRDILTILRAFNDPDLPDYAKQIVMGKIMYPDYDRIPKEHMREALEKAAQFIDNGTAPEDTGKPQPRLMDWDQDAPMIVPAINKVMGHGDVRALDYLHWWTFLGYYMEIGEGLFSNVLSIRQKRAKGKKLEKYERDFERENKQLIRLKQQMSEDEIDRQKAEEEALKQLFGE